MSDARGHRLRVIDRGAGIPPEARAHVFERFYRADAAHAHAHDAESETGGAGLGLAIARWVAEAHGGSLTLVPSRAGETVFEARLPAEANVVACGTGVGSYHSLVRERGSAGAQIPRERHGRTPCTITKTSRSRRWPRLHCSIGGNGERPGRHEDDDAVT